MKRFVLCIIMFLCLFVQIANAEEDSVLSAGISINEVPQMLFGSWKVSAKLDDTNSYRTFKPKSADIWTLTRAGNYITLTNPFSGAEAKISVKTVEGNLIIFSKESPYNNKVLTDTVAIRLDKKEFSGINTISLKSYSNVDGHLIKSEDARYIIQGEKLSGEDVL